MIINIKKSTGVRLLTKDKICRENIDVVPTLEEKSVTSNGTYTAGSGYAGFKSVVVNVPGGVSAFDYQIIKGSSFNIDGAALGLSEVDAVNSSIVSVSSSAEGVLSAEHTDDPGQYEDWTITCTALGEGFADVTVVWSYDGVSQETKVFHVNVIEDLVSADGGVTTAEVTVTSENLTVIDSTSGKLEVSAPANQTLSGVTVNVSLYNGETEDVV